MFTHVFIEQKCLEKLEKWQLLERYKKAKERILSGDLKSVDFKKRRPYKSEKFYFRLNKQYRAICYID